MMILLLKKFRFSCNQKGMTLVEVMVTTFLSTALFAGIYMTFVFGHKTSNHYALNVKRRQQVRLALNWMTYELREAQNVFIVEDKDGLRINFFKKKVGDVSFIWKSSGEEQGILRRKAPMQNRILARGIDVLIVSYPRADLLKFEIISKNKDQGVVALQGQVMLRSKLATISSWGN